MLIAERQSQVYHRIDGGDGRVVMSESTDEENQPNDDTPERIWNVFIPISLLIFLISYHLIQSGVEPGIDQSIIDMLQNSNSFVALPYATLATILLSFLFYHLQFKEDKSEILFPTPKVLFRYILGCFKEDVQPKVKPLMTTKESIDSVLFGMKNVFAAIVVLTMAWANGSMLGALGTDRFFADWILNEVNPGSLPTLSFLLSFIMSLATGSSWSSMVSISMVCRRNDILKCSQKNRL
jgi:Na+/H+ antiporter NhaC